MCASAAVDYRRGAPCSADDAPGAGVADAAAIDPPDEPTETADLVEPERFSRIRLASDNDAQRALTNAPKMSELFLADEFIARHGRRWRYVKEWGAWYQFDNGWRLDELGSIKAAVSDMLREAGDWQAAQALSAANRRKLCAHSTVTGVMSFIASHATISTPAAEWDRDPYLLGVADGYYVDLRTGVRDVAWPHLLISRRCAVLPEPGEPSMWLAHLNMVLRGDQAAIGFLRRYLGYMLTGEIGEHALVFLYGQGRNGKGTVVETVIRILGDYGYAAPVNLLMESKQERHPVELAMLRGRRAVSCSEPPQGSRWDDGRIRSLTGGDTITARRMNQDLSSFSPTHKLILMGNHKPTLRSVDEAVRSRFNILDFSYTIPTDQRDPHFMEKLRAEWPQILNWMIGGCMEWLEGGLGKPLSMVESTREYLQDEDVMGSFLAECCEIGRAHV